MGSREKRALSGEDESNAKRLRVVEQEEKNQQEEMEAELEQDRDSVSLPDSDTYDLSSEDEGDVHEPEEVRPVAEEQAPVPPITQYMIFLNQQNEEFMKTYRPWEGPRLPNGLPDPAYLAMGDADNAREGPVPKTVIFNGKEYEHPSAFPYNHYRHSVWPKVFEVIREFKKGKPDEELFEMSLVHETTMSVDFCDNIESAFEVVMKEERPRRFSRTAEEQKKKESYEDKRLVEILALAKQYHVEQFSEPGHYHKFSYMFPPHMSKNLIEYICVVMGQQGLPLTFLKCHEEVTYPEYDQISCEMREFLESCFMMDTSVSEEFVEKVNTPKVFNFKVDVAVHDIYNEMNKIFCYDYENWFIVKAANILQNEKRKLAFRDGIIRPDSILNASSPAEAHQIFRNRYRCPQ